MKKRAFLIILLLAAVVVGLIILILGGGPAMEYYVSPNGSDKNRGTKSKPFATIAKARDAVAKVNAEMTEDITVYLRGGTYLLSSSIVFDANDSGTNGHRVIYKAFEGETPIVSGGRTISGWSLHDKEKNIYKASVGDLKFRQIFVNGNRAVRARTPNLTDESNLGEYLKGGGVTQKKPHQFNVRNPKELKEISSWKSVDGVEMVMVTHWKQKRARIESIEGNVINFKAPENMARTMYHLEQPGTPHFYENSYEFLDTDGEFYLDSKEGIVYYKPREGEDMSSAEVVVPQVQTLVDIRGETPESLVHDLTFEGITFQYSQWIEPDHKGYTTLQSGLAYGNAAVNYKPDDVVPGAIHLANADNVEIRQCTVEKTGAHGIVAADDVVSNCSLVGNLISDTAAGGIYLVLNDKRSTGNKVTDNTIEKIGKVYSNGCGILAVNPPDLSMLYNEIRDVRYTGISTGWAWNDKDTAARNHDVGYNLIHEVQKLHDDGGGIYTLGKIEGMKIHNNYIHSIKRSPHAGNWAVAAIYLDNGSCFKHVISNVIDNVEAAFNAKNEPNHDNTIEKNFLNGKLLANPMTQKNILRDNIQVEGSEWPEEAREIMKQAGPRAPYRR